MTKLQEITSNHTKEIEMKKKRYVVVDFVEFGTIVVPVVRKGYKKKKKK